ncbi:MAG: hypothetical protein R2939_06295 [Kofleriaceae bacterium]
MRARWLPVLLAVVACGSGDATPGVDAAPVEDGWFVAENDTYDLVWFEAFVTGAGAEARLVVRGSGRPAGRCDPSQVVACYEFSVSTTPDARGAQSCSDGTSQVSVLIDGGTSAAYLAGGAFGQACGFSVNAVGEVGEVIDVADVFATLLLVGQTEIHLPVTGGALTVVRGPDR